MRRYSPLLPILALLLLGTPAISHGATAAPWPPESDESEEFELEGGEEFELGACEAGFEGEALFEECEEEDEEEGLEVEEECEEGAEKRADGAVSAPPACMVRRAESKITTLPGSDRVELTVHYATWSPAAVSVGLALKDGKGTLNIEHATKHFGLGGTLRLSTRLGDAVMERAAKAKEFDISLRAAKTPSFCGDLLEQHLRTSKPVGRARVYSDRRGD